MELLELAEVRERHKGKRVVLTGGVFDILHKGHIYFLETVKNYGDILVVSMTSDKRTKEYKGPDRPINSQEERAFLIDSLKVVDYTCIDPDTQKGEWARLKVIENLKPDIFITIKKDHERFRKEMEKFGTELKLIEIESLGSTTSIIEKIKNQT